MIMVFRGLLDLFVLMMVLFFFGVLDILRLNPADGMLGKHLGLQTL